MSNKHHSELRELREESNHILLQQKTIAGHARQQSHFLSISDSSKLWLDQYKQYQSQAHTPQKSSYHSFIQHSHQPSGSHNHPTTDVTLAQVEEQEIRVKSPSFINKLRLKVASSSSHIEQSGLRQGNVSFFSGANGATVQPSLVTSFISK